MSDDPETTADEPADPPTPEEFEEDPSRSPEDETLENIKGG